MTSKTSKETKLAYIGAGIVGLIVLTILIIVGIQSCETPSQSDSPTTTSQVVSPPPSLSTSSTLLVGKNMSPSLEEEKEDKFFFNCFMVTRILPPVACLPLLESPTG